MRQRRDAALRRLWLMLVASVILPAILLGYASLTNYTNAFSLTDERNDRALDIAAERAFRVFQLIKVTFDSV